MAKNPWRCSQCGTVNEPAANACRTCGRWPSLFDLDSGAVEADGQAGTAVDEAAAFPEPAELPEDAPYAPEPVPVGEPASTLDPQPERKPAKWRGPEPSIPELPAGTWVRRLSRLAIPVAIVVYVLISALTGR